MSSPPPNNLWPLLNAVCDSTLAETQVEELATLLNSDSTIREVYLNHVQLRRSIWLLGRAERVRDLSLARVHATLPPSSPVSIPTFLSTAFPATLGYSSGWSVAYLTATVITGLWILSLWLMPVSHPEQIATHSVPPAAERQLAPEPLPASVGRITGMVDCKWNGSSRVSLGQKYELASGLMEITYDTGAKVILQGPVTYSVEANGGYLAVGRLTGKLEKQVASGQWPVASKSQIDKSQIPNSSSLSTIHYPLFTIRTPTAIVTDLGTEFGVEVTEDKTTNTQVFVGQVQVTGTDTQNSKSNELVLRAGQAAICDSKSSAVRVADSSSGVVTPFVRTMTTPRQHTADAYADLVLSMQPAVYYHMEPPKDAKDRNVVFDSAPGHHHGVLHFVSGLTGEPYVSGRFGHALLFRGSMVGDYVFVPDYPKAAGDRLTVSAWVLATGRSSRWWSMIAANWGGSDDDHFAMGQFLLGFYGDERALGSFVTHRETRHADVQVGPSQTFPLWVWQHVALVADRTVLHLYRNGMEVASRPAKDILPDRPLPGLTIGCLTNETGTDVRVDNPCYWQGRIGELAIFHRVLSADEIGRLFQGPGANIRQNFPSNDKEVQRQAGEK